MCPVVSHAAPTFFSFLSSFLTTELMRCLGFRRSIIRLNFRCLLCGAILTQINVRTASRVSMALTRVSLENPIPAIRSTDKTAYQANTTTCSSRYGPSSPSSVLSMNFAACLMNMRSFLMCESTLPIFADLLSTPRVRVCIMMLASFLLYICTMLSVSSLRSESGLLYSSVI